MRRAVYRELGAPEQRRPTGMELHIASPCRCGAEAALSLPKGASALGDSLREFRNILGTSYNTSVPGSDWRHQMPTGHIEAVTINQDTSCFVELLLRSLYATHSDLDGIRLTILDNNSTDEMQHLTSFAEDKKIPIVQTKWDRNTPGNNHGENLRDFVLSHQDCDFFLFLDADIVFVQDETVTTMASELAGAGDDVWAVQARFTEDGETEVPWAHLTKEERKSSSTL